MDGSADEVAVVALALLCGVADRLDDTDKDKLKEIITAVLLDEESDIKFDAKEVECDERID